MICMELLDSTLNVCISCNTKYKGIFYALICVMIDLKDQVPEKDCRLRNNKHLILYQCDNPFVLITKHNNN